MTDIVSPVRLSVDGTYNLREVSGYRVGPASVRDRKLYRSDGLHALSASGQRAFAELGIRLVVDLRSDDEVAAQPSLVPDTAVIVRAPIFADSAQSVGDRGRHEITLTDVYDLMIDARGAELTAAVRLIAASGDDPVLVHCAAGKDRTGIVIALALRAIGVSGDEVVADYTRTAANLAGDWADATIERMRASGVALTPAWEEIATASPAEAISRVVTRWDSEWGSAADYLRAHGMTDGELAALTGALLRPIDTEH